MIAAFFLVAVVVKGVPLMAGLPWVSQLSYITHSLYMSHEEYPFSCYRSQKEIQRSEIICSCSQNCAKTIPGWDAYLASTWFPKLWDYQKTKAIRTFKKMLTSASVFEKPTKEEWKDWDKRLWGNPWHVSHISFKYVLDPLVGVFRLPTAPTTLWIQK